MAMPRLPKSTEPDPQEAVLTVERRPVPPDLSYIPSEIADHFEAKGLRVTLASALDNNISLLSLNQRFPLYADEIPPSVSGENCRNLTRYGFRIEMTRDHEGVPRPSGLIKKGDCCLFAQPLDARAEEHDAAMLRWLEQDSPSSADNVAEEINGIFMRDPNAANLKRSRVSVSDAGRLSDHAGRMFG